MADSNSSTTITAGDDENQFFEAFEVFPFYDCTNFDESDQPISPSYSIPQLQPIKGSDSDKELYKSKLRRRRTFSHYAHNEISDSSGDLDDLKSKSSVSFDFNDARLAESTKKFKFLRNLKRNDGYSESSDSDSGLNNGEFDGVTERSMVTVDSRVGEVDSSDSKLVGFVYGRVSPMIYKWFKR